MADKASDASSDNPVGSGGKVSGNTTTVLPVGTEPEPVEIARVERDAPESTDSVESAPETDAGSAAETESADASEPEFETEPEPEFEPKPRPEREPDAARVEAKPAAKDDVVESAPAKPREPEAEPEPSPPRVAVSRGTRLAERYRLEHRLSQNGRSETWRAVDEKLRRAVGVHIVPAGGEHGRAVIAAARAAALMGDPRFVQVLDCAEQDGLIYVVKEWLPDADNLTKVFESAPLPPHEVYELSRALAQAMSVAHRAGLSHLRLTPENVLRMHTGQYKIVGLAVEAALYGHDTTDAARDDTRAVGALMYAALTRRWVNGTEYGLQAAPHTGGKLCTPGQIRAGIDDTLAALAMRALGHEVKHDTAFETPGELAAAIGAMPQVLPPEPDQIIGGPESDEYPVYTPTPTRTVYPTGHFSGGSNSSARPPIAPPPPLSGRFGATVKSVVAVLVVLAIVLVTWQIASHMNDKGEPKGGALETGSSPAKSAEPSEPPVIPDFRPKKGKEIPIGGAPTDANGVSKTYDGKRDTYWHTNMMKDGPTINYNGRTGYGIVYDLGKPMDVRGTKILLGAGGDITTITLKAAPGADSMPSSQEAFDVTIGSASTTDTTLTVQGDTPVKSQYVLVLMTAMPQVPQDVDGYDIFTPGRQNAWREVTFSVAG
ncbi:protein kinase family protein [Embleya sp. NBC_00896]|uniref:protein kinase family protein n=1 Tax=Embleya sp. NBC_00896 TaxID=2975961 RepID=UPI0038636A28|nr:protein kinase family protein [Embleya sp. NBC_00896]